MRARREYEHLVGRVRPEVTHVKIMSKTQLIGFMRDACEGRHVVITIQSTKIKSKQINEYRWHRHTRASIVSMSKFTQRGRRQPWKGRKDKGGNRNPLSSSLTHHDTQRSASPPTVGTTLHSEITGETKVKSF